MFTRNCTVDLVVSITYAESIAAATLPYDEYSLQYTDGECGVDEGVKYAVHINPCTVLDQYRQDYFRVCCGS